MDTSTINLSENEQQYFGDLFTNLADNDSKLTMSKAMELFATSYLCQTDLEKIVDLCGASRLGHFGRSQFYIALKLIACTQFGLPLSVESLSTSKYIPLPLLKSTNNRLKGSKANDSNSNYAQLNICQLPPPPPAYPRLWNDSPIQTKPSHSQSSSPEADNSPRFTENSSKSWEIFTRGDHVNWEEVEEGLHLLSNEDDSDHGHSSDEEDVWALPSDKRQSYIKLFKHLNSDVNGKISGSVAKRFFEISHLSSQELSKIWRLSDVDKDGALSCEEFCLAMHLIVLRRNNVELPEYLPSSLDPKKILESDTKSNIAMHQISNDFKSSMTFSPQSKQWTKFNDSPTTNALSPDLKSIDSNLGMQPANFDFNAASIEKDPKILHPIALRVSPDLQAGLYENDAITFHKASIGSTDPENYHLISNKGDNLPFLPPPPPPPLPRPHRRHGHTRSSSLDLNCLQSNVPRAHCRKATANLSYSPCVLGTNINLTERKGAFSIYKKNECSSTKDYSTWIEMLKLKYPLPQEVLIPRNSLDRSQLIDIISSLKKRNAHLEWIYNELISELAMFIGEKSMHNRLSTNS